MHWEILYWRNFTDVEERVAGHLQMEILAVLIFQHQHHGNPAQEYGLISCAPIARWDPPNILQAAATITHHGAPTPLTPPIPATPTIGVMTPGSATHA